MGTTLGKFCAGGRLCLVMSHGGGGGGGGGVVVGHGPTAATA